MYKCGLSEVVITPRLGSPIPGSVSDRLSTGTKDDLYAKSAVIETDGTIIALIALDAIDVPRWVVERVRSRVHEFTGIPAEHVMVTSTHTHTGGPTIKTSFVNAVDEAYLNQLADKAADAAVNAYNRRTEAKLGIGRGREADIAFNRRFRMADGTVRMNPGVGNPQALEPVGAIDPDVFVIRIDDAAGHPLGVITNYACHACVVGGLDYSGDYPGQLSRSLKRMLGPDVVSLFFPGACGDINHIDVSGRFPTANRSHYQVMGDILAGEAVKVRAKTPLQDKPRLQVKSTYVPVRFREPTAEQIAESERVLGLPEKEAPVTEVKFAKQILAMARKELSLPDAAQAEIQA
ncbi:MAG: Neutral ceramidase, partial [Paenibacillus sp.]|nr:Neutral ceramidase [Paenibacillus sp.]